MQEAAFHDLDAFSISTDSYKPVPFPFPRGCHRSCRPLYVEKINVIGRSKYTECQPSRVLLDIKDAKDGVLNVVEANAVGANTYAAVLGKNDNINKRLKGSDDPTRVGNLHVSYPITGFVEQVDIYMVSSFSHKRST